MLSIFRYDAPDYALYQSYTYVFSFILPVGIAFIPVISIAVKRAGVINTLHITNAIGCVVGALVLVPNEQLQLVRLSQLKM